VALNGIDHLRNGEPTRRGKGPVKILHVGTLYHSRDPRPFLNALATARERHQFTSAHVAVSFVGNCRWFGDISLEAEIARRGLGDLVALHDWVPHEEIGEMLEEADILLLLAQNQPDQVPNKLYEYLGTGKVILAWADEPGESARMLRVVGGHLVVSDQSGEKQAEMVAQALGLGAEERTPPDRDVLEQWRTENQMASIVTLAEELT
jgi:glycosyltransferase involved in cell wall biosynthesis